MNSLRQIPGPRLSAFSASVRVNRVAAFGFFHTSEAPPWAALFRPSRLIGIPFGNLCLIVLACAMVAPARVKQVMPAQSALEIMREVERRVLTDSQTYEGFLEVADARGKALNKSWHFWREGNRGRSKILVRFDTPPEVRGVGLLTINKPNAPAEQWLYTPAIQRDRRVAPQEKSQRFMGTDLTNEDMEERSIEDYEYSLIGDDSVGGQAAYKIRAVYRDPSNTQYSQLYIWVRKDIVASAQIEFYVGGKLRKTMRWDDWKQIQGIWTPLFVEVKDLARNSSTRIRSANVQYNVKFDPDWFSQRNLRKTQ